MMILRECRATRRNIDETGLDEGLAPRASEHISVCASCREFHDQRIRLREMVGSLQPVDAPADFDVRLRARLVGERAGKTTWFAFPGFVFGTPAVAMIATVIVLAGAIMLLNRAGWFSRSPHQFAAKSQPPPKQVGPSPAPGVMKDTGAPVPANVVVLADDRRRAVKQQRNRMSNVAAKPGNVTSRDFTLQPAPVFTQNEAERNAAEISLSKPFEFSLQDSRGVTHKISLPPVSFGSQQLMQNGQRFPPASYSANRVW